MRVFVLCSGRCGSKAFSLACRFIENYTAGHETNAGCELRTRLNYPDNHIEIDNRLLWYFGPLFSMYGDSAYYVHLTRERADVIESFRRRGNVGIMNAWKQIAWLEERQIPADYVDVINANIEWFLSTTKNHMALSIDEGIAGFDRFCGVIGARVRNKEGIKVFNRGQESCRSPDTRTSPRA